jgi:teichuronic acid biosynthesis glycosyltransferase TuaG
MVDVSVIIPTYNAAKYLPQTIESILTQENVILEILVVDDFSQDNTDQYLRQFAHDDVRIKYIRLTSNAGGPAHPRNIGVQAAVGVWVAFCDADDVWHPKKLINQLNAARSNRADLVCCEIQDFNDGSSPEFPSYSGVATEGEQIPYWIMLMKNRIATSSVLCKKDALFKAGLFDESPEFIGVEDYDCWLRLMEIPDFKVFRIPMVLVAYRKVLGSLSRNKWRQVAKAMRVPRVAFIRRGWGVYYVIASPFIFASYISLSLYWRVLKGRL